jgi:SseB protein N-terminal domain
MAGNVEAASRPEEGAPDAALATALAEWSLDRAPAAEAGVQAALVTARLLVPIVPLPREAGTTDPAEMSRPTLIGHDGRSAAPAFTCVTSMAAWRADARPVAALGREVLAAAAEAGHAVVLDVAGPVTYVVEDEALTLLATGVVRLPDSDIVPEVLAGRPVAGGLSRVGEPQSASAGLRDLLTTVLASEPLVAEAYLLAPEEGPEASDVAVGLVLSADVTPTILIALVRRIADALGAAPDVPQSLDIAVLTDSQRSAARALGSPVHAAHGGGD